MNVVNNVSSVAVFNIVIIGLSKPKKKKKKKKKLKKIKKKKKKKKNLLYGHLIITDSLLCPWERKSLYFL